MIYSTQNFTLTDIDECISGSNNCSQEARCSNTHGSYSCECLTGHKGDGFTCEGYISFSHNFLSIFIFNYKISRNVWVFYWR